MDYIMLQKLINFRMVALESIGTHRQPQMVQGSVRLQGNNGFVLTLTDLVKSPDPSLDAGRPGSNLSSATS